MMRNYSLYLGNCSCVALLAYIPVGMNSLVASHPCAAPFGQPAADQKHSRCFCLKNLASNDVHGSTEWHERQDADSGLEQNRSSLSLLGHSRYLSNILRQISQKFYSFMQYSG